MHTKNYLILLLGIAYGEDEDEAQHKHGPLEEVANLCEIQRPGVQHLRAAEFSRLKCGITAHMTINPDSMTASFSTWLNQDFFHRPIVACVKTRTTTETHPPHNPTTIYSHLTNRIDASNQGSGASKGRGVDFPPVHCTDKSKSYRNPPAAPR